MITADEQADFLDRIRQGDDRQAAAVALGHTASEFRRLSSPGSRSYDPEFAVAFIEACRERDALNGHKPAAEPKTLTHQGFKRADFLEEEELGLFIEQVENGVPAHHAAHAIGTSMTQINRRAMRDSQFERQFQQAKLDGYPMFKDKLRSEAVRLAFTGDYRALRDLLLVHAEEYQVLMKTRHEITGPDGEALRILAEKHLPSLPSELLDQLIEHAEQAQLEAGPAT